MGTFVLILSALLSLLPLSPMKGWLEYVDGLDWLNWLNWFIPFDNMLTITTAFLGLIIAVLVYTKVKKIISKFID